MLILNIVIVFDPKSINYRLISLKTQPESQIAISKNGNCVTCGVVFSYSFSARVACFYCIEWWRLKFYSFLTIRLK